MRACALAKGRDERLVQEDGAWREVLRVSLPWPEELPHRAPWQVEIARDVSDRVALEAQLRQSEKMRALGTLSGGIAHDFNNLLTAVIGSLELVGDLIEADPAVRRLLDNAEESARRGAVLTRRLLDFSRPKPLELQAVDLGGLVRGMRELLVQSIAKRPVGADGATPVASRCVLEVSVEEAGVCVWSDPGQLEMAVLNLCINARDAMAEGGRIVIGVGEEGVGADDPVLGAGRYGVLRVSDEGCGMPPEMVARVFEPFFTTKSMGRGTGLGLSTIYGFLRQSGGDVRVRSVPGVGTEMMLFLPVAPEVRAERVEAVSGVSAVRRARILVVDDEAPVRLVTEGFLRQDGHEVVGVESAEAALALLEGDDGFGLVVLDLLMPGMNGRECGAVIRARAGAVGHGPAVLYVSGYADPSNWPEEGRVLSKPFEAGQLREAVQAALARGEA